MTKSVGNLLKYVSVYTTGKIEDLAKFSKESIDTLRRSNLLKFDGNNYASDEERVKEIYTNEYFSEKKFLGI